jgi:aerobic-type carbon monoxide dehydrogenase small subunit (CoxS/CutS family)
MKVSLTVNGKPAAFDVEPRATLADSLRHDLRLTGTHIGCAHGVCGACTVLVNGDPVRSCLILAVQTEGASVTTVEGLSHDDHLTPLQASFRKHFALQCGFCTPGILMSFTDFLARNPHPTEPEIRDVLSGHLCRCTGYTGIVNAVKEVAGGGA